MYRNQYLITNAEETRPCLIGAEESRFGAWRVFCFPPLRHYLAQGANFEALLIGLAVDPLHPARDMQQVLDHLVDVPSLTPAAIAARVEHLTGRFVLLLRIGTETHVWGDSCHLRQILYGNFGDIRCVGSSEKLMLDHAGVQLSMGPDKRAFMASSRFKRNEHAWVGPKSLDDRVFRLLPNHRLSLPGLRAEREAFHYRLPDGAGEKEVLDLAEATLRGLFTALVDRYSLIVALTAGWDTRLLMAAALPMKDRISFFTFCRAGDPSSAGDGDVAEVLAARFGLDYERIAPVPVTPEFEAAIGREQLFPRVVPKTANIQHHLGRKNRESIININGNGAEVARCIYGRPGGPHSFARVCRYLGFRPSDPFVQASLGPWHREATEIASRTDVRMSDLAHWEQRMGIWGAATPFEQDIAIEEISPFNNTRLLLALLTTPESDRSGPDYPLFGRLLRRLEPAAAEIPLNPHTLWFKKYVDGSATATFLSRRIKHLYADRSLT